MDNLINSGLIMRKKNWNRLNFCLMPENIVILSDVLIYYAIFTAVRAVLANDKVDFSKHSGVIAYFQKEYIKTGIFDVKYSKYLQNAFQIRNSCDYDDFFIASKQDAEEQYNRAAEFYEGIQNYLLNRDKE